MRYSFLVTFFLALLLSGITFAMIIESGDAGKSFAANLSEKKCSEPDVAAVYVCSGNVVKAVSSDSEEGSFFYKPDGRVIQCKPVPPSIMGAECVQMLSPDPCFSASVCETTNPSPQDSNVTSNNASSIATLPASGTQKPLAPDKSETTESPGIRTTPVLESKDKWSIDFVTNLSENAKLLLALIIGGIAMFALTTFFYIRSL